MMRIIDNPSFASCSACGARNYQTRAEPSVSLRTVKWRPEAVTISTVVTLCDACAESLVKILSATKTSTCGCCTNGCVCWMHQDTPRGLPPRKCPEHAPKQELPEWPTCDHAGCYQPAAQNLEATRFYGSAKLPQTFVIDGEAYHFCTAHLNQARTFPASVQE